MSRSFCAALFSIFLLAPALAKDKKKDQEEAQQLLGKVREPVDIREAGSPPFAIRAKVEGALGPGKQNVAGSWMLTWQSPLQWREEISFPDYKQVRVASQGKLWTYRTVPYEPVRVFQLSQLLDVRSYWTLSSGQSAIAVKEKKHNGT